MKKKPTNTLADFKAAHDPSTKYINRIKEGLKSLASEGPEAWENEGKFIRRCGMANHQFPDFRDKFKCHWVEVPRSNNSKAKRVWFGNAKIAAKARRS